MRKIIVILTSLFTLAFVMQSCKKKASDFLTIPDLYAHFANKSVSNFYVQNSSNSVFKIPIGLTTVSDVPRTINVSVTSPTGAKVGEQYNLPSTSITIPAGQVLDSLTVQGLFPGFASGRIDTLVFTISGGDVPAAPYNNTLKLVMQKYCDVDLDQFVGDYSNAYDDGSYGPYPIQILSATKTSPTSGYLMLANLWDAGGSTPVRVDLDWSDPANFKTSVPNGQPLYIDSRYGQAWVRPVGTGTFSSCDQTFTLRYQVYVGAGSFAATVTTMAR